MKKIKAKTQDYKNGFLDGQRHMARWIMYRDMNSLHDLTATLGKISNIAEGVSHIEPLL